MFAYKFSMNTAGERSLSLHPAVSLSKPEWTTAGKTKRGCSGAHIEAGDRLDDFRTRETARAVGASIAFLFFFRVYIQHLHVLWHGKAYGARRPWNLLRPKINRSTSASHRYLVYLEILNTSIITFFFNYHWLSLRSIFHTARELLSDVGTGVSEFVIICT